MRGWVRAHMIDVRRRLVLGSCMVAAPGLCQLLGEACQLRLQALHACLLLHQHVASEHLGTPQRQCSLTTSCSTRARGCV